MTVDDGHEWKIDQRPGLKFIGDLRQRADDAEAAVAIENQFEDAPIAYIQSQWRVRGYVDRAAALVSHPSDTITSTATASSLEAPAWRGPASNCRAWLPPRRPQAAFLSVSRG
jgi:hypothetical protein